MYSLHFTFPTIKLQTCHSETSFKTYFLSCKLWFTVCFCWFLIIIGILLRLSNEITGSGDVFLLMPLLEWTCSPCTSVRLQCALHECCVGVNSRIYQHTYVLCWPMLIIGLQIKLICSCANPWMCDPLMC